MILYFLLFAIACIVAPSLWSDEQFVVYRKPVFFGIFFALALFAGLRGENVDYRDYRYYKDAYFNVQGLAFVDWYRTASDPIFIFLSNVFQRLIGDDGFYVVVLFFSILSIVVKFKAYLIAKVDVGFAVIFLLSSYLYLHEFIQLRAALAIALLMMSAAFHFNSSPKMACFVFFLAVMSHGQAIAGILIFFVGKNPSHQKYYDIVLAMALVVRLLLPQKFDIIRHYLYSSIDVSDLARASYLGVNMPSPALSGIAIIHGASYALLRVLGNNSKDGRFFFYLRIYSLGLFCYWLLSFSGVVSYRLLEQFAVFSLFAISFLPLAFKYKYSVLILHTLTLFYFYLIKQGIVNSYSLNFL